MQTFPLSRSEFGVRVMVPGASSPLDIRQILAIGRNYMDHAKEQGVAPPDSIMLFTKSPTSACLSGDDIVIPAICRLPECGGEQTDFEGELAVIIAMKGSPCGLVREYSLDDRLDYRVLCESGHVYRIRVTAEGHVAATSEARTVSPKP